MCIRDSRDTGTHDFSVRIHSEVTVSMQVQVKGEIEEIPAEQETESLQTDQNDAEQGSESLQADQNDVEKDLDKNETVISQKNAEG